MKLPVSGFGKRLPADVEVKMCPMPLDNPENTYRLRLHGRGEAACMERWRLRVTPDVSNGGERGGG